MHVRAQVQNASPVVIFPHACLGSVVMLVLRNVLAEHEALIPLRCDLYYIRFPLIGLGPVHGAMTKNPSLAKSGALILLHSLVQSR
jgi:hypothetical protein